MFWLWLFAVCGFAFGSFGLVGAYLAARTAPVVLEHGKRIYALQVALVGTVQGICSPDYREGYEHGARTERVVLASRLRAIAAGAVDHGCVRHVLELANELDPSEGA